MESRTLKSRVRRRRETERRRMLLILFLFALALGLWLWYYFIYTRTPEYALSALMDAANRRDPVAVERYVHLERTLSRAYDDLTDDMLRYDASLTAESKARYQAFYGTVKPQMTEGVEDVLLRFISSGEWSLPQGASLMKGRQLGVDFERFLERSQLRNIEIDKIERTHILGMAAEAHVSIRDRATDTPFLLRLRLERTQDGRWQVVRMENYKLYLDTLAARQNRDIADYIAATHDIVAQYNRVLGAQCARFAALTQSARGRFSPDTAAALKALLETEVIPALKERQEKLDAVAIPRGAAYLANLRHASTDLAIAAWTHYLRGLETGSVEEFNAAETLLKQEVETDLRITDIIHHNTVSQSLPDIP